MLIPCEVASKTVLPAFRALVANDLVEKHGMKQKQAAQLIGLSQSAISKYSNKVRGNTLTIETQPGVQTLVDRMVNLLIHDPERKTEVLSLFCQACKLIRKNSLMCPTCKQHEFSGEKEDCSFCKSL